MKREGMKREAVTSLSPHASRFTHHFLADQIKSGNVRSLSLGIGFLLLGLGLGSMLYGMLPRLWSDTALAAPHDHSHHDHGLATHEGDEGLMLVAAGEESVHAAPGCLASAPVRAYDVLAINVQITLNRYLDYDPTGRMYVLAADLARVRQEETQNQAARADSAAPAVSLGLQGDAIQPLVVRVNQGECLRITLTNELADDEPASLHLHGSGLIVAENGAPAIAANPTATVYPSQQVTYEWWVSMDEPEGTHYFHSHGDHRTQTGHGLFGAVIVEPAGSRHLNPLTGSELQSGWAALIETPAGSDFREFALLYHEIGNERYRHLDKVGRLVTQVDPFTGAYRPGDRALNYRSEPFMNRLQLQQQVTGFLDESLAYSSYAFGDPATPILRAYLGDPVKQRLLHGGSEVFHVHHVHGGAVRWRRQPSVEPSAFDSGLDKQPPLIPLASERIDAQAVGPAESYDVENECGSGGCQQGAGDYLYHCHVAHHYFAGMWGIWRVYNTLQDGLVAQDSLPPLQELPDRAGRMQPAVTSLELVDSTVEWQGKTFEVAQDTLAAWVERQLPPPGQPKGYDASVMDWQKQGSLYLNQPESEEVWPGYRSDMPGERPPIRFDPITGKLAYPFLRPHLAQRPPFAPNHGPAPFLEPIHQGSNLPRPGENGPWSLCPEGTKMQQFTIHAINVPVALNERIRRSDPSGQLFVLKEQEAQVRAENWLRTPLAIRANAGESCVDVLFKSELADSRENGFFSKVSLHIHFVQFDVQASDGVNTGFNYEQTVRPFSVEGETISTAAAAGARELDLSSAARFQPGVLVGVGMDDAVRFEVRRIEAIRDNTLIFAEPLRFAHAPGEIVSSEFLRQRWYPDVQFGTAYFHDHVNALNSWQHGLFGALIAEPPGATYHDPHSGTPLLSGPIADVHTDLPVSHDVRGSFREFVLFLQDDNPRTRVDRSSGSSLNLRVEPLDARPGDPAQRFSSSVHGDPATPLLEAYLGDPLVIRGLVAGSNDVHTLHVDGHWFRAEPWSASSPPVNTVHIGVSERYDLSIPAAGGPQRRPGDYLYYNGRAFKLREGNWGLIRVHERPADTTLQLLPEHGITPAAAAELCPSDAPQKMFDVVALESPLPMLGGKLGKVYALAANVAAIQAGTRPPEPLVLHVAVGDCLRVHLRNQTAGPVSFHADGLAADPHTSAGVATGYHPAQAALPGSTYTYTLYAHPEVGETVALVRDWGDVLVNPALGLYGAIVVGPPGARYTDPTTGADVSGASNWQVDVHPQAGSAYRDFTLFLQDEDPVIGTHIMPYSEAVAGVVGLNYRREPLAPRRQQDADTANALRSAVHGDPATPLLQAYAGDPLRLHVLVPYGEQAHVFSVEGHRWPFEPGRVGTDLLDAVQIGPLEAITLHIDGAGGVDRLPGDYLYGDHREPYREAGLWGVLRVDPPEAQADLQPLVTGP